MSKLDFDKLRVDLWVSGTADEQGNGGYCALLYSHLMGRPYTKTIGGYAKEATITRMTLKAVVEGLKAIKQPSFVHIYTQIPQVSAGLNKHIHKWAKQDWLNAKGQLVKHADLWQEIYDLIQAKTLAYKVHYKVDSPNPEYNLFVIHRTSEYARRAKRLIYDVALPS